MILLTNHFCFLLGVENELVSGSSDKLVIVWKKNTNQDFTVSYMFIRKHLYQVVRADKNHVRLPWASKFYSWASENGDLVVRATSEISLSSLVSDNFQSKTSSLFA